MWWYWPLVGFVVDNSVIAQPRSPVRKQIFRAVWKDAPELFADEPGNRRALARAAAARARADDAPGSNPALSLPR